MKRKIIHIDEEKCTGCGKCIPNCPEGALQLIDGKARLISDLFCDGLGACIGTCPEGAIDIEEREAESYDEKKIMVNIIKAGPNTIKAHLQHLKEHGEHEYLRQALEALKEKEFKGCPGMRTLSFDPAADEAAPGTSPSALRQWPIQMHLVSPNALYFQGADVLLSADCVAHALGDFHATYLKGRSLAIACPKLDTNKEIYIDKLTMLIDEAKINTLTVMIMEVPCCRGLLEFAKEAAQRAARKVPIKCIVVGIKGKILSEERI